MYTGDLNRTHAIITRPPFNINKSIYSLIILKKNYGRFEEIVFFFVALSFLVCFTTERMQTQINC